MGGERNDEERGGGLEAQDGLRGNGGEMRGNGAEERRRGVGGGARPGEGGRLEYYNNKPMGIFSLYLMI